MRDGGAVRYLSPLGIEPHIININESRMQIADRFTVVAEGELPPSEADAARGEGIITRQVTARQVSNPPLGEAQSG